MFQNEPLFTVRWATSTSVKIGSSQKSENLLVYIVAEFCI